MTNASSGNPLAKPVSRRKFLIKSGAATAGVVALYTTPVIQTILVDKAHASIIATPTPTPPPACDFVLTKLRLGGSTFKVYWEYDGPATTIAWITLNCPSGGPALTGVKKHGGSYFYTGTCGTFSPNTGSVADKTVDGNAHLHFDFGADISGPFSGSILFANGCLIAFDSTPWCITKIESMALRYTGPNIANANVDFTRKGGTVTVLLSAALNNGDELTFAKDAGETELGAKSTINITGGSNTIEVIHTSCSTPFLQGQPAPLDSDTGGGVTKGDPSPTWFVVDFMQKP